MKVTILYGTEYGNCRSLAHAASGMLSTNRIQSDIHQMDHFAVDSLAQVQFLLIITSTHGEGEPPDNAAKMFEAVQNPMLNLSHVRFSVCALGDSDYEAFCQCGRDFDMFLEVLGQTSAAMWEGMSWLYSSKMVKFSNSSGDGFEMRQ